MKFYTTYFRNLENLPDDVVPVAICAKPPNDFNGLHYRQLAPSYNIFQTWRATHDEGIYRSSYKREVLDFYNPHQVVDALRQMTGSDKIAFVCYEKPGEFCHRIQVAEWLRNAGYDIEEYHLDTTPRSKKDSSHADNHNKEYVNKKGEPVLRVTQVIGTLAKDQIAVWANLIGLKGIKYRDELERTANVGSMFHAIAEQYMDTSRKRLAIIDYEEYGVRGRKSQVEATNAIHSFFKWYDRVKKKYNYHVKFTEKVIIGEKLGGTIDCGIDGFKDPEKVIFVDYKTSGNFYFTQFLQLAGYVTIWEEVYGEDTVEGVMVILADKKDGEEAQARLVSRKELTPFILCFENLLQTAIMTRMLEESWYEITKEIK